MATEIDIRFGSNVTLDYTKGESFLVGLAVINQDQSVVDLTGATVAMELKKKNTDATPLQTLSIGSGLTITGTGNNVIDVDEVLSIAPTYYRIIVTLPEGTVFYPYYGTIKLTTV